MNSFPLLLLGFMGLAILIRGLIYFLKLSELKKWLAVETVITQSEIKRIERPEVNVKIEYFLPEIEYSYDISGKKYSSHVISVDPKAWMENDKKKIESYLESFKKNNICYVNPKRHSDSVLEPSTAS